MATRLIVYRVKDRPPINATTAKGLLLNLFSLNVLQKLVFWYLTQRYALKAYRHVRATGPINVLSSLYTSVLSTFYAYLLRYVPSLRKKVSRELAIARNDMQDKLAGYDPKLGLSNNMTLPDQGKDIAWLNEELKRMEGMRGASSWRDGKTSGAVYHGEGGKVDEAIKISMLKYLLSNPLHPDIFPEVRKMEAEVVRMILDMYNAPPEAAGTTSSGGTESILIACKAYRDWARKTKGITEPEMVIPVSAHAAFDKASSYFKIKLHKIPVDPVTRQVNVALLRRAINPNTIMIVGSACNFGDGIIDPIPALSEIALKYKIGLHVDCCLGSFLVPFLKEAGYEGAEFDFRLKGVTSISCDAHKYGFAPKGISTILYRSAELRRYQYYVATDWPGGVYASPSMAGSRPGAIIAGAWSALMVIGKQGYVDSCREIVGARREIEAAVRYQIPEVTVMGRPLVSIIAFQSDVVDILEVGDRMSKLGWHLNALQNPAALHLCCTKLTVPNVATFVHDLKQSVRATLTNPAEDKGQMVTLYGLGTSNAAGPALVSELASMYIDTLTFVSSPALPSQQDSASVADHSSDSNSSD